MPSAPKASTALRKMRIRTTAPSGPASKRAPAASPTPRKMSARITPSARDPAGRQRPGELRGDQGEALHRRQGEPVDEAPLDVRCDRLSRIGDDDHRAV